MDRVEEVFPLPEDRMFREKLLTWASGFSHYAFLDSCANMPYGEAAYDLMVGAGCAQFVTASADTGFEKVKAFRNTHKDWILGYFGYAMKNGVEDLPDSDKSTVPVPDTLFFIPGILVLVKGAQLTISVKDGNPALIYANILGADAKASSGEGYDISLYPCTSKEDYIGTVDVIRNHIIEGDIYEMNYCQEFRGKADKLDPVELFSKATSSALAPFSVLFRWEDIFLVSLSPERFLRFQEGKVYAYPIKGTTPRGEDPETDMRNLEELAASEKNRAENIMITDLMRNDLTRYALTGSICADELCRVYSFPQVYQMVSKVSAELLPDTDPIDVVRNAFPMGSMTGAPKVRVMQLIDELEDTARGLYSGSFGYFAPNGEADLNVVIRSILYHAGSGMVSVHAGGAIVFDSDPEEEYKECLLKINVLLHLLGTHSAITR